MLTNIYRDLAKSLKTTVFISILATVDSSQTEYNRSIVSTELQ